MGFITLGIDHDYQTSDAGLRVVVESLVNRYPVSLIAEEAFADNLNTLTVARTVAESSRGAVSWLSIDMTAGQRKDAGIFEEIKKRNAHLFDPTDGSFSRKHIYLKRADGIREEYWLDQIEQSRPTKSVLVICGFTHLDSLGERISSRGWGEATKTHYLPKGIAAYPFDIEE